MTAEEFSQGQALLAETENEIAAFAQTERECCEQVRLFANGRRDAAAKRVALERSVQPLRDALAAHVAEMRQQHAEKVKAEAATKAAEPPSQLELLTAQVQKLAEALAAKS